MTLYSPSLKDLVFTSLKNGLIFYKFTWFKRPPSPPFPSRETRNWKIFVYGVSINM
jgi:hypothetical protein